MEEIKPVSSPAEILSAVISNNANALNNFPLEDGFDEFNDVPLEEFLYHAKIQRELEKTAEWGSAAATIPLWEVIRTKLLNKEPRNIEGDVKSARASAGHDVDNSSADDEKNKDYDLITEPIETSKENANRALRVASWGSVFYLITTDILGPTSAPYAIAELGYVPGALLYFLFGICAAYCGALLWNQFLHYRNPCCGTHLSNIGELKGLSILGQMNGKNGSSKINFVVGDRVFKYTRELYDTSKKLMATLNSNFEDLTVKADQIVAQQKKNQSLVKNLNKEIATIKSAEILQKINEKGKGKSYYVYREEGDLEFINKIYSDVKDTIDATESTLVLIAGTEKESAVVACGYNIATVVEELKKRVPLLKGGGKLVFPGGKYQGRAVLGRGELKHVLEYLESL